MHLAGLRRPLTSDHPPQLTVPADDRLAQHQPDVHGDDSHQQHLGGDMLRKPITFANN